MFCNSQQQHFKKRSLGFWELKPPHCDVLLPDSTQNAPGYDMSYPPTNQYAVQISRKGVLGVENSTNCVLFLPDFTQNAPWYDILFSNQSICCTIHNNNTSRARKGCVRCSKLPSSPFVVPQKLNPIDQSMMTRTTERSLVCKSIYVLDMKR